MKIDSVKFKVTIEPSAGSAPNHNAVITSATWAGESLEQVELVGDACRWAQKLFEFEMEHNLGLDPESRYFKKRVKQVRKALGYTYP